MTQTATVPKRVLLISAEGVQYRLARRTKAKLRRALEEAGLSIAMTDAGTAYDLAIAIGGDGTMMRAVTSLAPRGIPTLGVNAGDVGFLTSVNASLWQEVATRVIRGDYMLEDRLGLSVRVGSQVIEPVANEVVIRHGSSVATLQVAIGGQVFYEHLQGDGVLVSTATGSTGYNTSAHGPIVLPGSGNVVVTPLNPMSLSTRPIVSHDVAEGRAIEVWLAASKRNEPVLVIADGRKLETQLAIGDSAVITKYQYPLRFATFGMAQYARALTEKKGFAR